MGRSGIHNEDKAIVTIQENVIALKKKINGNVYIKG